MEGSVLLFIIGLSFCGASPVDSGEITALQCGELEEYSSCIQGGCVARNCSQLGKPVPCIRLDPRFCRQGCVCKEDYLRGDSGECVKKDQCQEEHSYTKIDQSGHRAATAKRKRTKLVYLARISKCDREGDTRTSFVLAVVACENAIQCSQNEVFSPCVNGGCDARNCSQLGRPVPCVKMDPKHCVKGCVCKPGYLRGTEGCVEKEQCRKELCPGPHEYFACGGACDNVCATLREQSQQNCPIVNIKCNEMCYCEEGYARDAGGVCVPIHQCT